MESILFFFFLEHAGELRIFVLRRREWPIYITDHPPWARMGDGWARILKDLQKKKSREVGPDQNTLMASSLYLSYTQGPQPLISCSYPKLQFLLISSQSNLEAGSWSIKDTCITVFQNDPSSQHDQWIKPFFVLFRDFNPSSQPPISQRNSSSAWDWPNLSSLYKQGQTRDFTQWDT